MLNSFSRCFEQVELLTFVQNQTNIIKDGWKVHFELDQIPNSKMEKHFKSKSIWMSNNNHFHIDYSNDYDDHWSCWKQFVENK